MILEGLCIGILASLSGEFNGEAARIAKTHLELCEQVVWSKDDLGFIMGRVWNQYLHGENCLNFYFSKKAKLLSKEVEFTVSHGGPSKSRSW